MIDLGISKMALIGAVALVVIGPEKLPRVARTVGTLLGKAQRYVNDVKAEVNRSMELDELRKMKDGVEGAAREVEQSIRDHAGQVQDDLSGLDTVTPATSYEAAPVYPVYRHPKKNWRLKQGAVPQWYKARNKLRTRTQSGAARVARHRPRPGG
ncbi:Sec-independent protein translocase protein TatB [uncultured Pseudacidovorax sp.]|uniref:Sec-independent protein translocase protein TatB n=1 Tax=uncultured Pseudacidovorax sp. TaxID=679313 RepID=UPI0025FC4B5D|nr:Sec-independent protein translocase protein TatB [uncultured Pseudacidovorax sp.]